MVTYVTVADQILSLPIATDHQMRQGPSPDVKYDWTYLTSFDQICLTYSVKTEEKLVKSC